MPKLKHSPSIKGYSKTLLKLNFGKFSSSMDIKKILVPVKESEISTYYGNGAIKHLDDINDQLSNYSSIYASTFNTTLPSISKPDFLSQVSKHNAEMMDAHTKLIDVLSEKAKKFHSLSNGFFVSKSTKENLRSLELSCNVMAKYLDGQRERTSKIYEYISYAKASKNPEALAQLQSKNYSEIFSSTNFLKLNDIKEALDGKEKMAGAINTVNVININGKKYVTKKGQRTLTGENYYAFTDRIENKPENKSKNKPENKSKNKPETETELPKLEDMNTAQRDVAVSRVDTLLDLNVCAPTRLVLDEDGEYISVMDFVEAKQCSETTFSLGTKSASPGSVNIFDPSLNSSLMHLAALDYICGHADRHLKNYMIDKEVTEKGVTNYHVLGIDNDISFGHREEIRGSNIAPIVTLENNFPFIEKSLANKIKAVKPEALSNSLQGLLDQQQIQLACNRLITFQDKLKNNEIDIIDPLTEDHILTLQNKKNRETSLNANLLASARADKTNQKELILNSSEEFNNFSPAKKAMLLDYITPPEFCTLYKSSNKSNAIFSIDDITTVLSKQYSEVIPSYLIVLSPEDLSKLWRPDNDNSSVISRDKILTNCNAASRKELCEKLPLEQLQNTVSSLTDENLKKSYGELIKTITIEQTRKKTNLNELTWKVGIKPSSGTPKSKFLSEKTSKSVPTEKKQTSSLESSQELSSKK